MSLMKDLILAVEVLSPSSTRADRFTKRIEYQRQRVPAYWIVDADERVVEVWTPDDTAPRFERCCRRWLAEAEASVDSPRRGRWAEPGVARS
jgi:Uma2 family endonuclease